MNLTILCNADAWGGLEINVAKLARWLQERGNDILVLAPQESKIHDYLEASKVTCLPFQSGFKYANLRAAHRLKKILQKHRCYNLLVSHSKDINLGVFTKMMYKGLKLVYHQQGSFSNLKIQDLWQMPSVDS